MYSTMLMCQPLPYSLIPLETERLIVNERLLPGITKVLRIAQDFPQIDWDPSDKPTWEGEGECRKHSQWCSSVFCYENSPDSASNGTLNLLGCLPVASGPTESKLHNLRLEFIKRVFSSYLQAETDFNEQEEDPEDNGTITIVNGPKEVRTKIKSVLIAIEKLSVKQIFIIYKQLAHDLKPRLESLGLLN